MLTNFETPAALFGAIFATLACILLLGIRRKIGRRSGISYEKITSFFESMRDECARNRKETGEQGQAQREEQRRLQEAFEKKIEANFQGFIHLSGYRLVSLVPIKRLYLFVNQFLLSKEFL